jgi:hypothetical protein
LECIEVIEGECDTCGNIIVERDDLLETFDAPLSTLAGGAKPVVWIGGGTGRSWISDCCPLAATAFVKAIDDCDDIGWRLREGVDGLDGVVLDMYCGWGGDQVSIPWWIEPTWRL